MKLEGALDAFGLPDILSLLSATAKTGTLHLTADDGRHGVVHLRDGAVTGARSRADRQELGRRLVGAGLVDEAALERAVARLGFEPTAGLGRVLAATVDPEAARTLAGEQAVDAVFDLLRRTGGAFAFAADEVDPDDVGAALAVAQVVAEAQSRVETWSALSAGLVGRGAVTLLSAAPSARVEIEVGTWWLLTLVDGTRTVQDLVDLSGRGEYAVVRALAELVARGLLEVQEPGAPARGHARRQALLAELESPSGRGAGDVGAAPRTHVPPRAFPDQPAGGSPWAGRHRPVDAPPGPPAPRAPGPGAGAPADPRVHGGGQPASRGGAPFPDGPVHGTVHGATALAPDATPRLLAAPAPVSPQEGVDSALLMRLIAGVRGL